MGIFRTNDPNLYDDIDGIIIDETAPPPSISGVSANTAILMGQFQRGPAELSLPLASIGEFHEVYGKSSASGNKQLKNKRFGALKLIRVIASDAAGSSLTLNSGATPTLQFDALHLGAYGDNIEVTVEDGSESVGKKYTIEDKNADAVLPIEVYDQVEIASVDASTFSASKLVSATVLDTAGEPDSAAAAPLAGGSDGTVADTDYESAMVEAETERAGNLLFLDAYNATRNGYLKTHVAATQDKMAVVCGAEGDDRAAAIADVANYRDTDGRLMYAWPYVQTSIDGALEFTPPASWVASIFTQVSPHIALSKTSNSGFLGGVTALKYNESRTGFISLDAAGVLSMERDPDIGFLVKNAVTTQIINSSKRTVLRRRMADFLTDSIALFLKNYQNDVNSQAKRDEVKAQILDFDTRLTRDGIVPGENDVKGGSPLLVDVDSLNTDSVIASGQFRILYKRRIYSSMRYIILQAEIGESVVVTEA
jgi:hypothetical protein